MSWILGKSPYDVALSLENHLKAEEREAGRNALRKQGESRIANRAAVQRRSNVSNARTALQNRAKARANARKSALTMS